MRASVGIGIVCIALMMSVVSELLAEVPNRSPEQLMKQATHVVIGDVVRIYERKEQEGLREVKRYLAEVRIKAVEKGEGIETGSLIYVRYFTRSNPPGVADTAGHRGLPKDGDHVRIYLARNASDGFDRTNNDGGFNVLFPNGFEQLPSARND